MKDDDWDQVLATNLTAAFRCIRAVLRPMIRQRAGRIINVASIAGEIGNIGQANYVAAKAGLIGLTKATAREVASRGVTVNAVAPGLIDAGMTERLSPDQIQRVLAEIPMGRMGTSEEVAHAVVYLASDDAAYITGQVLNVDGGLIMR
jgi:3-oxoacyl-[acyl-carrier protein] reductase